MENINLMPRYSVYRLALVSIAGKSVYTLDYTGYTFDGYFEALRHIESLPENTGGYTVIKEFLR